MEQLTKQQIILLALLVSFVSSIATGIVTVSLLDQAPPGVTQTINRVVERTIEKVGPNATSTVETVIVKEDQAIVDSIAKASKSIARIRSNGADVALGIITSVSGRIVAKTDGRFAENIVARLDGGNEVPLDLVSYDEATGISTFRAEQGSDIKSIRAYTPAELADSSILKLGQSVIAIGGFDAQVVSTGIISAVMRNSAESSPRSEIERIITSVKDSAFDSHAILVNLLGEVIGIKAGSAPENGFRPSNVIKTYATP